LYEIGLAVAIIVRFHTNVNPWFREIHHTAAREIGNRLRELEAGEGAAVMKLEAPDFL